MATIADVASAAGVSRSTVSGVLNGNWDICSQETRIRVLDCALKTGYQRSNAALVLSTGRTNVVAIGCERPDDPHPARMLAAANDLAQSMGFDVILIPLGKHQDVTMYLSQRRADVVMVAKAISLAEDLLDHISAPHQIVIAAGPRAGDTPRRILCSYWHDQTGIRCVLEHLVSLGHTRIAYLAGTRAGMRMTYFQEAAAVFGAEGIALTTEDEDDKMVAGAEMARRTLDMRPRPSALFARTDAIALGALHAVQEAGLRVPEDISIAGYYDFAYSRYLSPSLTSVYTPFTKCALAVLTEALQALKRDPVVSPEPRAIEFPTELRVRGSTGPAPV